MASNSRWTRFNRYHDPPTDSPVHEVIVDDLDGIITYRPSDRWNTTAKAEHGGAFQTITQSSTVYGADERTAFPEFVLDFTGMHHPQFTIVVNGRQNSLFSSRSRHYYMVCTSSIPAAPTRGRQGLPGSSLQSRRRLSDLFGSHFGCFFSFHRVAEQHICRLLRECRSHSPWYR